MSLNWKEIDLVLSELPLTGAHIQGIRQPEFPCLVLDLYTKQGPLSLLISLEQGKTRLHRKTGKTGSKLRLQRFAQFLRSRIKGARIKEACQLGRERIVKFTITRGAETFFLYCRLWSGSGNIIAADERGNILDSLYRRPKKGEISGGIYRPEESFRKEPDQSETEELKTESYIVRNYDGFPDFNSALEDFYKTEPLAENLENIRRLVLDSLDRKTARLLDKIEQLETRRKETPQCRRYREMGDLILSNPKTPISDSRWIKVSDFYNDNAEVLIEIDPLLSFQKNAEIYYEKYQKAKKTENYLEEELIRLRLIFKKTEALRKKASEETELELLKKLASEKRASPVREDTGRKIPGLSFVSGEFRIIVGRTAAENDELLRRHIKGNDLWLHVRDYPGSYVFIKAVKGKTYPLDVLLDAGNLALYYSKGRSSEKGELYYTQAKYLRRAKNGKRGLVIPTQEKNLSVKADRARLDTLFNKELP